MLDGCVSGHLGSSACLYMNIWLNSIIRLCGSVCQVLYALLLLVDLVSLMGTALFVLQGMVLQCVL